MAVQQHTFPEIEGPDFVRSSEVEAVADRLALRDGLRAEETEQTTAEL